MLAHTSLGYLLILGSIVPGDLTANSQDLCLCWRVVGQGKGPSEEGPRAWNLSWTSFSPREVSEMAGILFFSLIKTTEIGPMLFSELLCHLDLFIY